MPMMFRKKRSVVSSLPRIALIAIVASGALFFLMHKPQKSIVIVKKQQPVIQHPKTIHTTHTIKAGDNVSSIFKKMDIPQATLQLLLDDHANTALNKLAQGHRLEIEQRPNKALFSLRYTIDEQSTLVITSSNHLFTSKIEKKNPESYNHVIKQGEINRSLYLDARDQGIPRKIIMEFSKALGWKINEKSLRQGDTFSMTYESNTQSTGHIMAGQLKHRGKNYQFYCPTLNGKRHCYDELGHSTEAKFLRIPLKSYKRISDPFDPQRKHPILKTIRPHWGTDFAAPYKTPIHATADGMITYIGRRGGFGNFIEITHGQGYTTRYAHMAKFASKLKKGSHVSQDQVIGYVGNTGLSTGNHLHYEIRIHDKAFNPMTVTLPGKPQLTGAKLQHLKNFIASLVQKKHA